MMNKFLFIIFFLFVTQLNAVEFKGKFIQGHFIIGKTNPSTKIIIDKKKVKVSKDGYFAFGIEKDRKLDIVIIEGNKTIIKNLGGYLTAIKIDESLKGSNDIFTIDEVKYKISEKIKKSFDPKRILNPGKMYTGI